MKQALPKPHQTVMSSYVINLEIRYRILDLYSPQVLAGCPKTAWPGLRKIVWRRGSNGSGDAHPKRDLQGCGGTALIGQQARDQPPGSYPPDITPLHFRRPAVFIRAGGALDVASHDR